MENGNAAFAAAAGRKMLANRPPGGKSPKSCATSGQPSRNSRANTANKRDPPSPLPTPQPLKALRVVDACMAPGACRHARVTPPSASPSGTSPSGKWVGEGFVVKVMCSTAMPCSAVWGMCAAFQVVVPCAGLESHSVHNGLGRSVNGLGRSVNVSLATQIWVHACQGHTTKCLTPTPLQQYEQESSSSSGRQ